MVAWQLSMTALTSREMSVLSAVQPSAKKSFSARPYSSTTPYCTESRTS
jgi:hypothetical protein